MADLSDVVLELEGRIIEGKEQERWLQQAREKKLWYYRQIQIYEAQQLVGSLGKGVKVGIVDTGIDYNHEQFRGQKILGIDITGRSTFDDPLDSYGHGTQVAGIIAGKEVGIAPEVELYVVKIRDKNIKKGKSSDFVNDIILGLMFCEEQNCDLVNLSLGTEKYNALLKDACIEAYRKGIILVASAGNRCTGARFPAAFREQVVSIGAVDSNLKYAETCNVWPKDLVTPGEDIFTTNINNQYQLCQGTSYATPQVTGILALAMGVLKERKKSFSPQELRQLLHITADTSVCDEQQAEQWIEQYDPSRTILRNPPEVVQFMFGAGLVQAKEFLNRLYKL